MTGSKTEGEGVGMAKGRVSGVNAEERGKSETRTASPDRWVLGVGGTRTERRGG